MGLSHACCAYLLADYKYNSSQARWANFLKNLRKQADHSPITKMVKSG